LHATPDLSKMTLIGSVYFGHVLLHSGTGNIMGAFYVP
jgi:hypothetical protein